VTPLLSFLLLAYLLGSLPFSAWIARSQGVDLRKIGSGNVGATNVLRALGPRWGALALFLDAAKGALAVLLGAHWGWQGWSLLAVGFAAILGHVFSFLLGFKGGKGVATSLGVFMALEPLGGLTALMVFAATVARTRYVSLGAILGGLTLVVAVIVQRGATAPIAIFASLAWLLLVIRHRSNIQRILAGTESRIGESVGTGATP
jgi:glycerol-3-phosphate acyltransferase PlsY